MKLAVANQIIQAALAEGRTRNFAPLVCAVFDAGGNLISYQREDGSGIVRFNIAFGKAWGSLGMGFGSRELTARTATQPHFVAALSNISGGRAVPSPGGVLIADDSGSIIGAVGVSGDTGDNDEICALAGITAVGLRGIPGKP